MTPTRGAAHLRTGVVKALIWSTGLDTGGQGERIRQGFLRHVPEWTVDVLNSAPSPLGYPEQYPVMRGARMLLARRLYGEADVIHLRNTMGGWKLLDGGRGKPTILHHHGSMYRTTHGSLSAQARRLGAVEIASTLDLTLLEPGVEWLPVPYQLDELAAIRAREYAPSDTIRIAHFPTSTHIKSTKAFLAATANLAQRYPIEVLTNTQNGKVRHEQWTEILARKASADIYFDQAILGYGNNAVEAWGMGIPVVAGVRDPAVRAAMLERFGILPFVETTEQDIERTLERLIQSAQMRAEYSELGLQHVRRFHDDGVVVTQLRDLYASAPRTRLPVVGRPTGHRVTGRRAA